MENYHIPDTADEQAAPSPLREEDIFPFIEACLFAAGHPVKYEKLGSVLGLAEEECREVVEKMKLLYNSDEPFRRGIILVTFPDSCQLCTREAYGAFIKQALGIRRGGNLSQSLLEVLSIIAYNQPATRAFIETVRGVDSGYAVSTLVEKNLIECCGRLDAPGRPSLYRTTEDFLRIFGLSAICDLPSIQIKNSGGETIEIAPIETDSEEPVGAIS
ncbi:MAG: SMC-Scp complex subunit ScpB [Ruminococcaceae bacterium]|nr:SMC-Scp complex subunit ScpB [Oscillospiraceae bacterium]